MLKRQKVYVAGALVNTDGLEVHRFEVMESKLSQMGFAVVNPSKIIYNLPEELKKDLGACMGLRENLISLCNDVVVIDDYAECEDVIAEIKYAEENNINVTYEYEL